MQKVIDKYGQFLKTRDPALFREFYKEYSVIVFYYAYQKFSSKEIASNLTVDVFDYLNKNVDPDIIKLNDNVWLKDLIDKLSLKYY